VRSSGAWALRGALLWPVAAPLAAAGLSFTPTATSDYDYRGVTQTANGPALQLAFDYNAPHAHLQCWTSNVTYDTRARFYGASHTEVAWTADIPWGREEGWSADLGVSDATYPGLKPYSDYAEGYATLAHGDYSLSYHYAWDYDHLPLHRGAYYLETNASWPIGHAGLELIAHLGQSGGPYWREANGRAYQDFAVGAVQRIGRIDLTLRYVGTRDYVAIPHGRPLSGSGRLVLSVTTTLRTKRS